MKTKESHKIGHYYSGMGYSGLTDGIEVRGKLHEVERWTDHAIIIYEKTGIHCAVIYKTLKLLK